jgi:hypothetical protein
MVAVLASSSVVSYNFTLTYIVNVKHFPYFCTIEILKFYHFCRFKNKNKNFKGNKKILRATTSIIFLSIETYENLNNFI